MAMTDADELLHWIPLFPLPLVLFPGMRLPLHIFEPRYHAMMHDSMAGNQAFGVTLHLESPLENVAVTTVIGTLANILQVKSSEESHVSGQIPHRMDILTQGVARFKILDVDTVSKPYFLARIAAYDDCPEDVPDAEEVATIAAAFKQMLALRCKIQKHDKPFDTPSEWDPVALSFRIAEYLNHDITLQQAMLEMTSTRERLVLEMSFITKITKRLAALSQINQVFNETDSSSD